MHATARQATILSRLSSDGSASVADLAKALGVSDETIRRDIKAMADQGLLRKVHGGAVVPDLLREPTFQKRLSSEATAKTTIARHIADRIINGDSLFLDMGSTTTYIARALAQHRDLLIVTNGAEIARILSQGGRNRVHLTGGEMRADDGALLGPTAVRFIESFRVRLAILSVGAIDLEDGFLVFDPAEAEVSQTAMRRAKECVIAADHAKFGASAPVFVADFGKVQRLVTDSAPPAPFARKLDEAGVKLEIAGQD